MADSVGYPNVIAARASDNNAPTDIQLDSSTRAMFVALWTWNTSSLEYEKVADINSKLDNIISLLQDIKDNTAP